MADDGGRAFPWSGPHGERAESGMTLRDWFAGQAIGRIPPSPHWTNIEEVKAFAAYAAWSAYVIADALLARRERSEDGVVR